MELAQLQDLELAACPHIDSMAGIRKFELLHDMGTCTRDLQVHTRDQASSKFPLSLHLIYYLVGKSVEKLAS